VTGLRARGGFEVTIVWRDRRLSEARVLSRLGRPCHLRVADAPVVHDDSGPIAVTRDASGLASFATRAGQTYIVRPRDAPPRL
jgi:alpha-L-fucosidase 2